MRGALLVVMALSMAVVGLVGCGGKDKPPLTPDTDNALLDAGADPSAPPAAPTPGK